MAWSKMVDLALTDEEKMSSDVPCVPIDRPKYPYGLCISLDQSSLEKLKLDTKDVSVGDMVDLRAFAVVTSISENDTSDGPRSRVELQIEKLAVEDEATESTAEESDEPKPDAEAKKPARKQLRAMYRG